MKIILLIKTFKETIHLKLRICKKVIAILKAFNHKNENYRQQTNIDLNNKELALK